MPVLKTTTPPRLEAYIINLARSPQRWEHMQSLFQASFLKSIRVNAIDGFNLHLPDPRFDEKKFHWKHGRNTNIFEIACYLSHLEALQQFLNSKREYALICEDDIIAQPHWESVIEALLTIKKDWDLVRLSGLSNGASIHLCSLTNGYQLGLTFTRLKGAGAYLIQREIAEAFLTKALPMWLPWDHAIDREWSFKNNQFRNLTVSPFPFLQTKLPFESTIQVTSQPKLSQKERLLGTYPYQAMNEMSRCFYRTKQLISFWTKSSRKNRSVEADGNM